MHCFHTSYNKKASYRRLQRFLGREIISQSALASFILSQILGPIFLAIDRTNWSFGKTPINILVLSVVWNGSAIPLFWKLLPHKGCSAAQDRIELIERFLELNSGHHIAGLLMDREFIGPEWLGYLENKDITFFVRLRNNIKIGRGPGELIFPKKIIQGVKANEVLILPSRRRIGCKKDGMKLFVSVTRSSEDDLVIVVSNKETDLALDFYRHRWGIETLFGHLKTRGFSMEDTHLRDHDKISNLLIALTLSFFWSLKLGWHLNEIKPIKIKKHTRKEISYFRLGLNALVRAPKKLIKWFLSVLFGMTHIPPPSRKILEKQGII
jgi:hypothetical protein